jgi:hypothetical protein
MNLSNYTKLIFAAALLTSVYAKGSTFDFSYAFSGGGPLASGSFEGTRNGNLIDVIGGVTLSLNGTPLSGPFYLESWTDNGLLGYVNGGAVVSIDGTQNNFLFINTDYANNDYSYTAFFGSVNNMQFPFDTVQTFDSGPMALGYWRDFGVQTSWSVSERSSVPDTTATFTLLGASFIGLAALRLRFGA